jgi:hypothetical protein
VRASENAFCLREDVIYLMPDEFDINYLVDILYADCSIHMDFGWPINFFVYL